MSKPQTQTLEGFPGVPKGYRTLRSYLETLRINLAILEESYDGRSMSVRTVKDQYRRTIRDLETHIEMRDMVEDDSGW